MRCAGCFMKSRLILNPASGSDDGAAQLPSLNEQLRERIGAMDIVMTVAPGDAHEAAAERLRQAMTRSSLLVAMER